MSSAARQRLLRSRPDGQLTLGGELDSALTAAAGQRRGQDGFAALADQVRATMAPADDPWRDSPYRWVKELPTASRGRAAVQLVERWLLSHGQLPTRRRGTGHDLLCGPDRIEVKLSTLWASGEYTFQGVRDGAYDLLILLGISPHQAHLWAVPRATALAELGRAHARAGWLVVPADRPQPWLATFGGEPDAAAAYLATRNR